jgi:hypothetical protein
VPSTDSKNSVIKYSTTYTLEGRAGVVDNMFIVFSEGRAGVVDNTFIAFSEAVRSRLMCEGRGGLSVLWGMRYKPGRSH